jgi:hypothetical protein
MIVSKALRDSAGHHDARCMLEIAGVCGDPTEAKTAGCVLAHIRHANLAGGAQKPDDLCATFACGPCHAAFDGNGSAAPLERGSADWMFYAMRGMARTLRWWHDNGFLTVRGAK